MIEVLVAIVFFGVIILYLLARFGGSLGRPVEDHPTERTSSEKLFDSKVRDAAFFDGESEDYAEVMSRLRTYGGV
ncbi:MAG: hypothetical protein ACFFDV_10545 [Candidatus Thorarchaeota archaeon]